MTDAVVLALIALGGMLVFLTSTIILVKMVLKAAPSCFKLDTEYGHVEVSFDPRVDE